ncbi:uncharacterized protein ACOB8E_007791 [Sarcophilus harrisii]
MGYGKVTSKKAFSKKMHQLTEDFIGDITSVENQDDLENINNVAPMYMENINRLLMDAVESEYWSQNEDFLRAQAITNADARDPIFELYEPWNLWKDRSRNFSCYFNVQQPRSETTKLQVALVVWECILKRVKEFWKILLDWLKEKIAALKNFLVSVWEGVLKAVNHVLEWFNNLF